MALELGNFPQDEPKELGKLERRVNPYRLSTLHMVLSGERRALVVNGKPKFGQNLGAGLRSSRLLDALKMTEADAEFVPK